MATFYVSGAWCMRLGVVEGAVAAVLVTAGCMQAMHASHVCLSMRDDTSPWMHVHTWMLLLRSIHPQPQPLTELLRADRGNSMLTPTYTSPLPPIATDLQEGAKVLLHHTTTVRNSMTRAGNTSYSHTIASIKVNSSQQALTPHSILRWVAWQVSMLV